MTLITANIAIAITSFLLGALVQDFKDMSKQERRQGAGIGLLVLTIVVISGIAH